MAHYLAQSNGAHILSADSMQVYCSMDIGTAKPSPADRAAIPYYGIDLVDPCASYSVGAYLEAVREQARRGHMSYVVGGSGLYVKALLFGLDASPKAGPKQRERWQDCLDKDGVHGLQRELTSVRPEWLAALADPENPRRLIRALEMAESGVLEIPGAWKSTHQGGKIVGLRMEPSELSARIEQRVRFMYRAGLVGEVQGLLDQYPHLSETARQAIGYAEVIAFLGGECTQQEAIETTVVRTRQLAKRQRTWFRHQLAVEWVEVEKDSRVDDVAASVQKIWDTHGSVDLEGLKR